jgi:hypothetical protein
VSRPLQLMLALVLACVAIAMVGYAAYQSQAKIDDLEGRLELTQTQLFAAYEREQEFYRTLDSFETRDILQQAVEADDSRTRETLVQSVAASLAGTRPKFPEGVIVQNGVQRILEAASPAERAEARDAIYIAIFGRAEKDLGEADILIPPVLKEVSGFISAIGGIGSGLISLLLFFVGGGKRKIEEDMLNVDLEMKRVELAKAQYEAREAIGAMKTIA